MDVSTVKLLRIGELDVSGLEYNSYLQGPSFDPVTQQWCLAQADPRGKAGDREDAIFHVYNAAGVIATRRLVDGGHPSVFDFYDDHLWHAIEKYDGDKKAGRDVHQINVVTGETRRFPMFAKWERAHLDVEKKRVISSWSNSSGDEFWTWRHLADVLKGVNRPQKTLKLKDHGTFQGAVSSGDNLFRIYGSTSSTKTELWRNSWTSGAHSTLDLDEGLKGPETPLTEEEKALSYEFEGATLGPNGKPVIGLRLGPPGPRRKFLLLELKARPLVVLKP